MARNGLHAKAQALFLSAMLGVLAVSVTSASGAGSAATATTLTASVSPTTVTYGSYVRVSGKLAAGGTGVLGRSVIVEYKAAGAAAFSSLGSFPTLEQGTYVVAVKPTSSGVLRARFAGDAAYGAATSGSFRIAVKADPYMYSAVRIVRLGNAQTIGVYVTPAHKHMKAVIYRRVGSRWVSRASGLTGNTSRFSFRFKPSSAGATKWRAYFAGDSSHASSYSLPITTRCQAAAPSSSQRPSDGTGPSLVSASAFPGAISPDGNGVDDSATFKFSTSEAGKISVGVYTVGGRRVRNLVGWQSVLSGYHSYVWNGMDDAGKRVADDVYVFRGYALDLAGNMSVPYPIQAAVRVGLDASRPFSPLRRITQAQFSRYVEEVGTAQGPDGSLHVVWHEDTAVAYKKLDRYGNTVINTVRIPGPTTDQSNKCYPAVAAAPDGTATVIWRDLALKNEDSGVFALQLDTAGRILGPFEHLVGDTTRFNEASTDGSGNIHLVARGSTYRPFYALYASDLTPLSGWGALTSDVRNRITRTPNVVAEPNGTAHIVWFDARDTTAYPYYGRYQIYYSKFGYGPGRGGDDSRTIAQLKVTSRPRGYSEDENESNDGGLSHAPSLDVDANGNAHIAWAHGGMNVSYAKISPAGAVVVHETTVAANIATTFYLTRQARLKARPGPDGGADIVFPRTISSSYQLTRLASVRVDSGGTRVAGPTTITPSGVYPTDLCMERFGSDLRVVFIGDAPFGTQQYRLFYTDQTYNAQAFDKTRPDLVVDDAHSTNGTPPKEGQDVRMTVQVSNCGWVTSTASSAEWWYGSTTFAASYIPPLGVDAVCSIGATWTMPANFTANPAWIKVKVDPANRIAETSENNNEVMHSVPVRLRPAGIWVGGGCYDETLDEARAYYYLATPIETTISGTIDAGEPHGGDPFLLHGSSPYGFGSGTGKVPPGNYTVYVSAPGYLPALITTTVAVSRSTTDPYSVTFSPPAMECWFNQWGQLTGRCTSDSATGLTGVKVEVAALGKSANSAVGGTYTVVKLREGDYQAVFTKDHYARVKADVTIAPAGVTVRNALMPATSNGYVDVGVVNAAGTPMGGQTVELRKSSDDSLVDSKDTDGNGQCAFEPPAGVSYYAKAARPYYVTAAQTVSVATAGHVYPVTLTMELDRSAVYSKNHPAAMISWVEHAKVFMGGEVWNLWGNYWTNMGVQYVKIGDTWHVLGVDTTARGNASYLSIKKFSVTIPVGGPLPLPVSIIIPDISDTYSNVRVDAVQLVNTATKQVYWEDGSQWYSNDPDSRQQTKSWLFDGDGVAVGTDDNWAVKMWVRIGNENDDHPETHYWAEAPILTGWRNDYHVITYYPATDKMYIDKVTSGYPRP
jgi:hypothetical protein